MLKKNITNVTIKDAPYELDNCYIATQMLTYGEVISGYVRRGYIKDTHVEKWFEIPPNIEQHPYFAQQNQIWPLLRACICR